MKHVDSSLHYKTFIHSSQLALSQCIKDQGITSFGKLYSHRIMQLTIDLHCMGVIKTYTAVFRSQMRPNSLDLERAR